MSHIDNSFSLKVPSLGSNGNMTDELLTEKTLREINNNQGNLFANLENSITQALKNLPSQQQEKPLSGKEIVDANFQPQPQQQNNFLDILQNAQSISGTPLNVANRIGYLKNLFNDYDKQRQQILAKSELNDDEKLRVQQLQAGMDNAHEEADMYRSLLGDRLGIFGQDMDAKQYGIALANNQLKLDREIEDAITGKYGLDSDSYWWKRYDEYRQQGRTKRDAGELASRDARQYQAERVAYLDSTLNQFGFNADGSMNRLGTRLNSRLGEENAIMGNVYQQDFASPKDSWNFNNTLTMADIANNADLRKLAQQFKYNLAMQGDNNNYDWKKTNMLQNRIDERNKYDWAKKFELKEMDLARMSNSTKNKLDGMTEGNLNKTIQTFLGLKNLYGDKYTDAEYLDMAVAENFKSAYKIIDSLNKGADEFTNELSNSLDTIDNYLFKKDFNSANEYLANLEAELNKIGGDYSKMDIALMSRFKQDLEKRKKVLNDELTIESLKKDTPFTGSNSDVSKLSYWNIPKGKPTSTKNKNPNIPKRIDSMGRPVY